MSRNTRPGIVFAHGIWADGSSFGKGMPALQAERYEVVSAQNRREATPGGFMMRYALVALIVLASGVATHLSAQSAGHATTAAKPTIVLVHGAWADASGWYDVTLALQARGYNVVAAPHPRLPVFEVHLTPR